MTEEEFLVARDIMAAAVVRAKKVLGYFNGKDESASVDLMEDGQAMVTTWKAYESYGDCYAESEQQYFPGHLLFCTDAEVDAWHAAEKKRQEAQYATDTAAAIRRREAEERALLEALRAKYG